MISNFRMSLRVLRTLEASQGEVTSLFWGSEGLCCGDVNGELTIYASDRTPAGGLCNLKSEPVICTAHKMAISSVCTLKGQVISCSLDGTIAATTISEAPESQYIATDVASPIQVYPIVSDNQYLVGTMTGSLHFRTVSPDTVVATMQIFENEPVVGICVHEASRKAYVLSPSEFVSINLVDRADVKRVKITAECSTGCSVAEDGLTCAVTTTEGTVRIIDTISFKEVGCIVFEKAELNKVLSIEYGKRFVVTSCDGRVGVFDLRKMIKEKGIKIGKKSLIALAVQSDDMKIAVAGCDSVITLLDFN